MLPRDSGSRLAAAHVGENEQGLFLMKKKENERWYLGNLWALE